MDQGMINWSTQERISISESNNIENKTEIVQMLTKLYSINILESPRESIAPTREPKNAITM